MLLEPNPPDFPAAWASAWGEDLYGLWQAFVIGGVRQVMRWIPPGRFEMGSLKEALESFENEKQHPVTLTRGLWLAETACTQALWRAVRGDNPSSFDGDPERPVEQVSWDDCQAFIAQANEHFPAGFRLRLPTEAEWEYACRAGTRAPFSFGAGLTTELANYHGRKKGEYRQSTLPVHRFQPNPWGLYQMHGNVWEWCRDWYGSYPDGPIMDPKGPEQGLGRVRRGGAWNSLGRGLRSAFRYGSPPDFRSHSIGLRLAGGFDPRAG